VIVLVVDRAHLITVLKRCSTHFFTLAPSGRGSIPFLYQITLNPSPILAYRSVHFSVGIGKQITSAYYGALRINSYFNGAPRVEDRELLLFLGIPKTLTASSSVLRELIGIIFLAPTASGLLRCRNTSRAIRHPPGQHLTPAILRECDWTRRENGWNNLGSQYLPVGPRTLL